MKKFFAFMLPIIMFFVVIFGLTSCADTLPTTNYEKVKFAFNGVENSLKGSNTRLNSYDKVNDFNEEISLLAMENVSNDNLSIIYNSMASENELNPEFKYDEPPFIQFQYMKALYEEVGESFQFGTKYSYTMTGDIYYDFTRRTSSESDAYLNHYTMILSIIIDIDSNNLITAEVSFDMTYVNGNQNHHQKRYAELVLDYDMNDSSPTYKLTMLDIDDLLLYEDEDEKYISEEYDYVNVEKNSIKEWRKFGVCSNEELTNYQNDNFVYKYSVLRGFKDNKKYKTENSYNKDANLKNAVINGLGFIPELTKMSTFFGKQSTQSEKIQTVVNKFNSILGRDIVNSFVYTGATENWTRDSSSGSGSGYENLFLKVETKGACQLSEDIKLDDLFNPNAGWTFKGEREYLSIVYKNGEENTLATYNDFNNLNVKVKSNSHNQTKWVDVDTNNVGMFTDYVKESGFVGHYNGEDSNYSPISLEFDISLKSNSNVKLQSNFTVELINNDYYKELLMDWNVAIDYIDLFTPIKDVIPEFTENSYAYFSPSYNENTNTGRIELYSTYDLNAKVTDYINNLKKLGFTENTSNSTYTKRISDDYVLILTIRVPSSAQTDCTIDFEFKNSQKSDKTITDAIKELIDNDEIEVPEYKNDSEYTVEGSIITIKTNTNYFVNDYVASLEDYGFTQIQYNGSRAGLKYVDGILYMLHDLGYSLIVIKVRIDLALVGDFNGWDETDDTYDMDSFVMDFDDGSTICMSKEIEIEANQKFKVVKDHSWDDGGYGYGQFSGSVNCDPKFYRSDNDDNIVVLESGRYQVLAEIGFGATSANLDESNCIVLRINIIKK